MHVHLFIHLPVWVRWWAFRWELLVYILSQPVKWHLWILLRGEEDDEDEEEEDESDDEEEDEDLVVVAVAIGVVVVVAVAVAALLNSRPKWRT